ncbi:MAG TPA: hypothetical protein VHY84_05965 [Bryobacteraceae bacterium]|nr:hypothetical protein [Bryobacteraceae bacterium]
MDFLVYSRLLRGHEFDGKIVKEGPQPIGEIFHPGMAPFGTPSGCGRHASSGVSRDEIWRANYGSFAVPSSE